MLLLAVRYVCYLTPISSNSCHLNGNETLKRAQCPAIRTNDTPASSYLRQLLRKWQLGRGNSHWSTRPK